MSETGTEEAENTHPEHDPPPPPLHTFFQSSDSHLHSQKTHNTEGRPCLGNYSDLILQWPPKNKCFSKLHPRQLYNHQQVLLTLDKVGPGVAMKWQWSVADALEYTEASCYWGHCSPVCSPKPHLCLCSQLCVLYASLRPTVASLWCLQNSCLPSNESCPKTHYFPSPLFPGLLSTSENQGKLTTPNTFIMTTNWCLGWWGLKELEWGLQNRSHSPANWGPPGQQGVWVPGKEGLWTFQCCMICLLHTLATGLSDMNPSPTDDKVAFDLFSSIPVLLYFPLLHRPSFPPGDRNHSLSHDSQECFHQAKSSTPSIHCLYTI